MNTAQIACGSDYPAMANMIATSGFQTTSPRNPQGILQAVQNFHVGFSPRYNQNQVKLLWKRPLNATVRSNVKSYRILRGTTNVYSAAVQIGTSTKTRFVDTNTSGSVQTWYYFVVAINDAGDGHVSDPVVISVLSI